MKNITLSWTFGLLAMILVGIAVFIGSPILFMIASVMFGVGYLCDKRHYSKYRNKDSIKKTL